jgi:crotonobetainyl-CoA:carnitine CoA-transferase CaiB-like acyl-CoA transferase
MVLNGFNITEVINLGFVISESIQNFSETPSKPGFAPELGEHNDEILNALGYNESQINNLRDIEAI